MDEHQCRSDLKRQQGSRQGSPLILPILLSKMLLRFLDQLRVKWDQKDHYAIFNLTYLLINTELRGATDAAGF